MRGEMQENTYLNEPMRLYGRACVLACLREFVLKLVWPVSKYSVVTVHWTEKGNIHA